MSTVLAALLDFICGLFFVHDFLNIGSKHNMVHLEKQYLSDGLKGLDLVKGKLKLLLLDGMAGIEFLEDRRKFHWGQWIEEQVQKAIFNPTWHTLLYMV